LERNDEAVRRIFESLGIYVKEKTFEYEEELNNAECQSKVIKFDRSLMRNDNDSKKSSSVIDYNKNN
jgi:hypothetical protein